MAVELRNPCAHALDVTGRVSSHASHVHAKHPGLASFGWLLSASLFPAFLCGFYPLLGDENVVADLWELAENFLAEQVLGSIPASLELEVVLFVCCFVRADGNAPALQLVDEPRVVHLSGDDDALLQDVGGCQGIKPELCPAVSLLASGCVADGGVGVEDQQDARVALQVALDCVVDVVRDTAGFRDDEHGMNRVEARPRFVVVLVGFEPGQKPLFALGHDAVGCNPAGQHDAVGFGFVMKA